MSAQPSRNVVGFDQVRAGLYRHSARAGLARRRFLSSCGLLQGVCAAIGGTHQQQAHSGSARPALLDEILQDIEHHTTASRINQVHAVVGNKVRQPL